jgi:hypothetical protein
LQFDVVFAARVFLYKASVQWALAWLFRAFLQVCPKLRHLDDSFAVFAFYVNFQTKKNKQLWECIRLFSFAMTKLRSIKKYSPKSTFEYYRVEKLSPWNSTN